MTSNLDAKVVLLGASSVGKTCIVTRATTDSFTSTQNPTVGAQFSAKSVIVGNTRVMLRIWDTAGQERYRALTPMYYRDSQAAVIVFSVTDRDSLADAEHWFHDLSSHFRELPLLYLVGNKADLVDQRKITEAEGVAVAESLGSNVTYYETSAKTGQNIAELFADIADTLAQIPSAVVKEEQPVLSSRPPKRKCGC